MAAPSPASRASGVIPEEWPAQAADAIVDTISKARDKTTKPAIVAARGLVYGLPVALVGSVTAVLLLVLVVRVLSYLPGPIWTVYAFLAVVFSVGGLVLLRKANAPASTPEA